MKETLMTAGFNTVLGIGTVFVMLIVMSLIIYCFRIIPMIQDKLTGKNAAASVETDKKPVPSALYVPEEEETVVDVSDDLALIAVITAAIAASEQIPVDGFRVRTIKRRK